MNGIQSQARPMSVMDTFPSLGRLWAANLYSQHPFLRLSSPFPSSGIKDSLLSPLATFLEMNGTDVGHFPCPWKWGRGQGDKNLNVKRHSSQISGHFLRMVWSLLFMHWWEILRSVRVQLQSRASQPQHYCHVGQDDCGWGVGLSYACRRFSGISGLYPPDASSTSHGCDNQKCPQTLPNGIDGAVVLDYWGYNCSA